MIGSFVGYKLGQFKLEHVIHIAIFLAPKVYLIITDKGEQIIKIKGLGAEALKNVTLRDFEDLLFPNRSLEMAHTKFFKDIYSSEISAKLSAYVLRATSGKRYSPFSSCIDRNGSYNYCLYKTLPYNYSDIIVDNINQ